MKKIKIYGERNSGTNYLDRLVQNNFDVQLLWGVVPRKGPFWKNEWYKDLYFALSGLYNLGWKHKKVEVGQVVRKLRWDDIHIITLTKNPYSFLLSLYKKSYHYMGSKPVSFDEFIQSAWHVRSRDNCKGKYLESPVDLWNIKNKSYVELKEWLPEITINEKYENLIGDPEGVMRNISTSLDTPFRNGSFFNFEESTKDEEKNFSYYQAYYLQEKWKDKLSSAQIKIINSRLDVELMDHFNYQVLK